MKKTAISALPLSLTVALFVAVSSSYAQTQSRPNVAGQEAAEGDVVRVSTTLVTVPVGVLDRQGRFVPGLSKGQFRLFENGVEQEIAYFEGVEKPFTVALLLDMSDSARLKLKDIQDAAAAFVEQLRPDDRVIVAAFDRRVTILAEATSDRRVLYNAIRRAQSGGGTGLYDSIDFIIGQRLSRIRGRKAIVLFTDGVDTSSRTATYPGTLRRAEELDAMAYAIQYNTYDDVMKGVKSSLSEGGAYNSGQAVTARGERLDVAYARANRYLSSLADKTGGRFFYADSPEHLREVFARIAQELRQQYSIGYYAKDLGPGTEQRRIKVRVGVPGVAVRARRGYVYKPSAGNAGKQ
jgi:Ca-activated chloride channel homolog